MFITDKNNNVKKGALLKVVNGAVKFQVNRKFYDVDKGIEDFSQ